MRWVMTRSRLAIVLALGLTLMLALAAVACGGDGEENTTTGGTGSATTVKVTMKDNSFDPKQITVPAGKEITFNLENKGQAIHDMMVMVDGKEIMSQPDAIRAGATGKLVVTFAKAGTYDFKCTFHPTEMTGKITAK